MTQGCPHGPDSPRRPNRSDCAACHRESAIRRARANGVQPRKVREVCAKRGHPLTEDNRRKGRHRSECKECHRIDQNARRLSDIEQDRRRAREYQRAHKAEALARHKAWRLANPEHARAEGRKNSLARRTGRTPDDKHFVSMLLRDPCCYCGEFGGTIDHIQPVARGGQNGWENLTSACMTCNMRKHDTPLLKFMLRFSVGA